MKVGILGNGQLAQLLTHAAYALAVQTVHIEETEVEAIWMHAKTCDVLTLENENVDPALLEALSERCIVYPGVEAVRVAQNRLLEKTCFQNACIPTTHFIPITTFAELDVALQQMTLPAILKTQRFGYDGKGQVVIHHEDEAPSAWDTIGRQPAILEAFVSFHEEVSLIAARHPQGEVIYYPLIKNTHEAGILRTSESPYLNSSLQALAEDYMSRLFTVFNYVGVLAFEFFVVGTQLIANEIAPRVHNSGHLTIEGFNVSQFETHLRCVLGLPLIKPVLRTPTVMHNIIGRFPRFSPEDYKNTHVYSYGKTERPGRKLGHITCFNSK